MRINFPPRVRAAIYIFTAVSSPVVGYLLAKGLIGELEMTLWLAEVTAVTAMAGLNVSTNS
jgi:hypothetical protein